MGGGGGEKAKKKANVFGKLLLNFKTQEPA